MIKWSTILMQIFSEKRKESSVSYRMKEYIE